MYIIVVSINPSIWYFPVIWIMTQLILSCFAKYSRTYDYMYMYVIQRCQPKQITEDCRFSIFSTSENLVHTSVLLSQGQKICFSKLARISGKKILLEIRSPNERVGIFTHCRSVYGYINYVYNKQ